MEVNVKANGDDVREFAEGEPSDERPSQGRDGLSSLGLYLFKTFYIGYENRCSA